MKTKAYGYTRVSGIGQTKGHGPERQREIIAAFARKAYTIEGYHEDAHTGTEANRPAFVAMLGTMMADGVKTVIVESLDRLARDVTIQSTLLAKLAAEGITLIAANTGEDVTAAMTADPMQRAMVQIQAVFAELDKRLLVGKLRKGRDAKSRELGRRCEGPLPYGADPNRPEEAAVVERVRQLRKDRPRGPGSRGISAAKIAADLNQQGLFGRAGRPWSKQTVQLVILDRIASKKGGV